VKFNKAKYEHMGLSDGQLGFLRTLIDFSRNMQMQTALKARDREDPIDAFGMKASVVAAFCAYRSKWGMHPLAQARYENETHKWPGNNLPLLTVTPGWSKRNTIPYGNKLYKSFKDIGECCDDFSDCIAIKFDHRNLLLAKTPEEQITQLSLRSKNPTKLRKRLLDIFDDFELVLYDYSEDEVLAQVYANG
jgi:hypothetical protein